MTCRWVLATIVVAFGCLHALPAHAAPGMKLRWDSCSGDGGTSNKNFACDTNAGAELLVASYEAAVETGPLDYLEAFLTIVSPTPPLVLSPWWQIRGTGQCRNGLVTVSVAPPTGMTESADIWQGQATGLFYLYTTTHLPAHGDIWIVVTLPEGIERTLLPGTEAFLFSLRIPHTKSVGTGSCSGCQTPSCLGLGGMRLNSAIQQVQPGVGMNTVGWQGGIPEAYRTAFTHLGLFDAEITCGAPSPIQNRTWGAIKTLYH